MAEMNIVEKVIALEAVDLLKSLTPDQLSRIGAIAREVRMPPDTEVLQPTRPLDSLYVILDGTVEILRNGSVLHVAGQNDVLGAWALFDPDPMPVTARTREDTRILQISREDFFDLLSDNMEIAANIFATLVKRFRKLVEG